MKRAISMPCTEAQFESIKERLLAGGVVIVNIDSFDECPILVNNYNGVANKVTNLNESYKTYLASTFIHEFNAEVFLDACGISTERQWTHEELVGKRFKSGDVEYIYLCEIDNNDEPFIFQYKTRSVNGVTICSNSVINKWQLIEEVPKFDYRYTNPSGYASANKLDFFKKGSLVLDTTTLTIDNFVKVE